MSYRLKFPVKHLPRKFKNVDGLPGRLLKLRRLVTALFHHERIEALFYHLSEARGYTELLIQEAIKYGDTHKATMDMADYWILEKSLVHKLFKVLVPRYVNYDKAFTQIHMLGTEYPGVVRTRAILELRDNPLPPVLESPKNFKNSLTNILIEEAKKEYWLKKQQAQVSTENENNQTIATITQSMQNLTTESK